MEIKFRVWNKKENSFMDNCLIGGGLVFRAMLPMVIPVVKEDVVIQPFTGLLDANGKEIYEGDILKEYINNETDFNIGECKQVLGGWKIFNSKDSSICWHGWKQEVIGNVLENPELLK